MNKQDRESSLKELETMGRMQHAIAQLQKTVKTLSDQIEKSHREGKIPADYSLGFANGVIFVEHMVSQRDGGPRFFDRTTAIGTLPVPIALRSPKEVETEFNTVAKIARLQEENFLQEQIIVQARGVAESMDQMQHQEEPSEEVVKGFSLGLAAMKKAINELDETMTKHQELLHAQKEAQNRNEKNAQSEPMGERGSQDEGDGSESQRAIPLRKVGEGQRDFDEKPPTIQAEGVSDER